MTKLSIYSFNDYKKFILEWLEKTPLQGRGQRKLLAEAIGCQTPFITHVLTGDYHFSLEQAEACSRWLELNEAETEFYLLLVNYQRAGTKTLKNLFEKQINLKRAENSHLKKRLKFKDQMTLEDQLIYYSHWYYAAVHMACLNSNTQTIEALKSHFNLTVPQLISALTFLTDHQFLEENKGRFKVLKPMLHLEKASPLLLQHHSQWRLKALESLPKNKNTDLFYSGVISLSQEDFEWLRERLSLVLEEAIQRIKNSNDETLACLNFDWFEI